MSLVVTARVQLVVEFSAVYENGDTQVVKIFERAGSEMKAKVHLLVRKEGGIVVGEPRVIAVMAEQEKPSLT